MGGGSGVIEKEPREEHLAILSVQDEKFLTNVVNTWSIG